MVLPLRPRAPALAPALALARHPLARTLATLWRLSTRPATSSWVSLHLCPLDCLFKLLERWRQLPTSYRGTRSFQTWPSANGRDTPPTMKQQEVLGTYHIIHWGVIKTQLSVAGDGVLFSSGLLVKISSPALAMMGEHYRVMINQLFSESNQRSGTVQG
jgi:hypothetical protein